MMRFDRITLGRQAKELGFVRDTFEKVCRLSDVLSFMESDPLLADSLALKGGTAINRRISSPDRVFLMEPAHYGSRSRTAPAALRRRSSSIAA